MVEDSWITPEEATNRLLAREDVVKVEVRRGPGGNFLSALNKHGAAVIKWRVFDGSEHPFALPGMLLDDGHHFQPEGRY